MSRTSESHNAADAMHQVNGGACRLIKDAALIIHADFRAISVKASAEIGIRPPLAQAVGRSGQVSAA